MEHEIFNMTCIPYVDNILVQVGVLWFSIMWWNETCFMPQCLMFMGFVAYNVEGNRLTKHLSFNIDYIHVNE